KIGQELNDGGGGAISACRSARADRGQGELHARGLQCIVELLNVSRGAQPLDVAERRQRDQVDESVAEERVQERILHGRRGRTGADIQHGIQRNRGRGRFRAIGGGGGGHGHFGRDVDDGRGRVEAGLVDAAGGGGNAPGDGVAGGIVDGCAELLGQARGKRRGGGGDGDGDGGGGREGDFGCAGDGVVGGTGGGH